MRKAALTSLTLALLTLLTPLTWGLQRSSAGEDFDRVAARAEEARSANRIDEAIDLYRKASLSGLDGRKVGGTSGHFCTSGTTSPKRLSSLARRQPSVRMSEPPG